MAAPPLTDWSYEPTDAYSDDFRVWPWVEGMDDEIILDMTPQLADGEFPTSPTSLLWRLKATTEADNTDVTAASVVTTVVDGTWVRTRLHNLERGRVYRLYNYHGPAGNKRAASVVIQVAR